MARLEQMIGSWIEVRKNKIGDNALSEVLPRQNESKTKLAVNLIFQVTELSCKL